MLAALGWIWFSKLLMGTYQTRTKSPTILRSVTSLSMQTMYGAVVRGYVMRMVDTALYQTLQAIILCRNYRSIFAGLSH